MSAASNPDEFKLRIQGVTDIEAGEVRGDAERGGREHPLVRFET
ncbi:MAG: hypothetical protein O3A25_13365 [Acidobacteria bacterium]|nr:hypothetical protein [Acidobacteriota bacterium]